MSKTRGFTLIEILTAVSIFLVVMTISLGSIVSIFDADRKSGSLRTVMGNLNLALESMAREMRFGKHYNCHPPSNDSVENCADGGDYVSFRSSENELITYFLDGTAIKKTDDSGTLAVTAPEIIIEDLTFYVIGTGQSTPPDRELQPKVLIKVSGYAGDGPERTNFALQTLVSQRALDITP